MSKQPELAVNQVPEVFTRENFRRLKDFFALEVAFLGFRFFTFEFKTAESGRKFNHNLGFLPKDIVLTSKTGPGVVTFNQDLTTKDELSISSTDAAIIRFLAGSFDG